MNNFTIWKLERDYATIRQGAVEFPVRIEISNRGNYTICFPANLHIIGNDTYHKLVSTVIAEHQMKYRSKKD